MGQMLERLRKAKAEYDAERTAIGRYAGKNWAEGGTEYREVVREVWIEAVDADGRAIALEKTYDPNDEHADEGCPSMPLYGEHKYGDAFGDGFTKAASEVFEPLRDLI